MLTTALKCICKNCGVNFLSYRSDRTTVCAISCNFRKHGMAGTKIYKIYYDLLDRCRNKDHHAYESYGGRGIKVCKRWDTFENFYQDMGDKPEGKSLDRIDNNKGYSKNNCRWATREQQSNNRRNTKLYSYNGKNLSVNQWSRELGIPLSTIRNRIAAGRNIEEVLKK